MLNEEGVPVSNIKTNVDVTINGTDALNTIAQIPEKGIAKLFHCLFGERDADIMRKKMLIAAQTEQDINLIQSGQAELIDDRVVKKDPENFINQMINHEFQQEINNLQGNLYAALKSLAQSSEEDILDDELNPDWFARWRREAKNTSDNYMQQIWGEILAEEIKKPTSFSYRTLDVLKNLSKSEAEVFYNATPLICLEGYLICETSGEREDIMGLESLMLLNECGLTTAHTSVAFNNTQIKGGMQYFRFADNIAMIIHSDKSLSLPVIPLSIAGKELLKVIECKNNNKEYFEFIVRQINKRNNDLQPLNIIFANIIENEVDISNPLYVSC